MSDELLEKLGNVFVYHNYYNRYGLTYEHFVFKYQRGDYHAPTNRT